jgi:indole-3-glycerol phosphate synthase
MSDTLGRICADKRAEVARRKAALPETELRRRAAAADKPRGFARALENAVAQGGYGLIAEIKKASPSKGLIRADFSPPDLARAYASGGATCLSVLTDAPYFQGADEHLVQARAACALPVLRKDFMLDPWQVVESRALGADCILVIMAAVDDATARALVDAAASLGMDALIEVHDGAELERALKLPAKLVGVNNRDLKTFKTDLAVTEALAPRVPRDRIPVAESGLFTPADLARMARAGARCFLVGEALMRQADVAQATRALLARPEQSARVATR